MHLKSNIEIQKELKGLLDPKNREHEKFLSEYLAKLKRFREREAAMKKSEDAKRA